MKKLFFKAEKTENDRLDVFLAGAAEGLSRAHALKLIEAKIDRYADIKAGLEPARRCEHCDYCKQTKVLTGPVSYLEGYDA